MSSRKTRDNLPKRNVKAISREVITNPSKGLNNLGSPSLIDNREWADLLNIEFDEGGVARKRYGYAPFGAALTQARGLGQFKTASTTYKTTIDDTTFKHTTTGTWTSVGTISFTAGKQVSFNQVKGKLCIWNGFDGGATWDGTTLARPGTMPKAKFSLYYSSFNIAAGVPGQESRVYVAALADPYDFTNQNTDPTLQNSTEVPGATVFDANKGANYFDVQPGDGDVITGLGIFQDVVIIFKQFSTYQMTLDAVGKPSVVPITRSVGCISAGSIVAVENDLYFLARDGVRVLGNEPNFYSSIRTNILSKRTDPIINAMNPAYYQFATATYYNNQYIISLPDADGIMSVVLSYNKQFQAWSKWDNFYAESFLSIVDTDNTRKLLFVKKASPTLVYGTQVHQSTPGVYNDNNTPINAIMLSKVFDFKAPDITKYFVDIGFMFRSISGDVALSVYTNGNVPIGDTASGISSPAVQDGMGYTMMGETQFGIEGGTFTGSTGYTDVVKRVIINTNSTSIRFRLSNNRVNENFVLAGYVNAFYPYGHYLFDSANKIYL